MKLAEIVARLFREIQKGRLVYGKIKNEVQSYDILKNETFERLHGLKVKIEKLKQD